MRGGQRRNELLRILNDRGYVNVTEAAQELGVDSSTIRRDLARLDSSGLIERSHGGATPVRDEAEVPFDVKLGAHVAEKAAIGRHIASTIADGTTLMLDSGTTSLMVARALAHHRDLTVITSDIRVAVEVAPRPDRRLIVPGGEAIAGGYTLVGQEAIEAIRRYHVDLAVICSDGVAEDGVTNTNSVVIPLKRAMIAGAQRVVLAMDGSKFGVRKLVRVAALDEFDEIVTDDGVKEDAVADYPVRVVRAEVREGVNMP